MDGKADIPPNMRGSSQEWDENPVRREAKDELPLAERGKRGTGRQPLFPPLHAEAPRLTLI